MTMTTVDRVVALHRVPLFADVPGRVLAALAMRAREVEVAAGDVLIEQGAVEDHLYAVVSGRFVCTRRRAHPARAGARLDRR